MMVKAVYASRRVFEVKKKGTTYILQRTVETEKRTVSKTNGATLKLNIARARKHVRYDYSIITRVSPSPYLLFRYRAETTGVVGVYAGKFAYSSTIILYIHIYVHSRPHKVHKSYTPRGIPFTVDF